MARAEADVDVVLAQAVRVFPLVVSTGVPYQVARPGLVFTFGSHLANFRLFIVVDEVSIWPLQRSMDETTSHELLLPRASW